MRMPTLHPKIYKEKYEKMKNQLLQKPLIICDFCEENI
jgi:hypothetical protein